jgi:murein DD-endopeptidase MepM/ murein hydrolase activator NlpD
VASKRPAPEFPYEFSGYGAGFGEEPPDPVLGEWDPTAESVAPVRGRHRVAKQRGGGMARSGAVLGVGVFAAIGAGGMATAQTKPPVSISMPDLNSVPGLSAVEDKLPDADSLPGIGSLLADDSSGDTALTETEQGADAGEALRARILQQAEQQQSAVEAAEQAATEKAAAEKAAEEAAKQKAEEEAAKKEAARKAAEEAQRKAAEEAKRKAAEEAARLAAQYIKPVSSYTLTAGFGQAGDLWSADHTGQDFAAPTGTPVKAIHGGTITEAGWAGAYGYRIVLTLEDGTELWYCHLSSMIKTSGEVSTGDTIGRVGATGNVTGPHLHLEVRPGGGDPIDPMPWLRQHGVDV